MTPTQPRLTTRLAWAIALALASGFAAAQSVVVTFDDGADGFSGFGDTTIEPTGGNPGAHLHTVLNNFGITYSTTSNAAFTGNLADADSVTVGIDVKVDDISLEGSPVPRNLLVEFRSHALAADGYPYASVYHVLAELQTGQDWAAYSVSVDPTSIDVPSGWGGYGAEDAVGNPMLPAGVTFADVMGAVDELAYTTFEPGYFYAFTDFDVRVDNLRIDRSVDLVFGDGFEG